MNIFNFGSDKDNKQEQEQEVNNSLDQVEFPNMEVPKSEVPEEEREQEASVDPSIEERATARGWRPKDEWDGDPDEWVDARTFLEKGELMDTISAERRRVKKLEEELRTTKEAIAEIRSHYEKLAKAEVEKALKELKEQRREAIRLQDFETADELEEQIDEIKREKDRLEEQQQREQESNKAPAQLPPEVVSWIKDNPWVDEGSPEFDPELAQEAVLLTDVEIRKGAAPGVEVLNKVKTKLERLYPEKFGKRRRTVTTPDFSGTPSRGGSSRGSSLVRKLSPEQRRIGQTFVEAGAVESLEKYAEQLKELGEL